MKFWDSSALVPLLLNESHSAIVASILATDPEIVVWWGTPLESCGAIWMAVQRNRVTEIDAQRAELRLAEFRRKWIEMDPHDEIRQEAERAVRIHDIRTADALQLAAAITAKRNLSNALPFVCLDRRLAVAAMREGLRLIPEMSN